MHLKIFSRSLVTRLLAVLLAVVLIAAACSSDDGDESAADDLRPGTGVALKIGRANHGNSYFLAEIHATLLRELGYEVANPSDFEFVPEAGFVAIAKREIDAWPSGWYPLHNRWLRAELADGSLVQDRVQVIGEQILGGGVQGYVIDKAFGERFNILTLDDLNANPEAIAVIDAVDTSPGDGVADIYGCPVHWTCDDVLDQQIAMSGWENIRQFKISSSYEFMAAYALAHMADGEPFVVYLSGPSIYVTQLRAGDNVYWLGVNDIVDDSNPAGQPNGEILDQRPGTQPIPASECPSAATREDGLCPTGFAVVDILVTANRDFVSENPVAAALMAAVKIPALKVSLAWVEAADGGDFTNSANEWLAANRDLADNWLEIARAAA